MEAGVNNGTKAQQEFRAAKGMSAAPSSGKQARALNPDKPLWHRQHKEGMAAYEAFMVYLAMGKERTRQKVADQQNVSLSNVSRFAQTWSWSYRVAAYEEHYMLLKLEDIESKKDDMWLGQEMLAMQALGLVGAQFDSMLEEVKRAVANQDKIEVMKPDALVRLFDTATKVQRMAVVGRLSNLADAQEREEKLAEAHAQELAELISAFVNDLELTQEQQDKAQEVLRARLTAGP